MTKIKRAIFIAVSLAVMISAPALAHAFVTRTDPIDGATLSEAPRQIRLWFSEEVALNLSKFAVIDSAGQSISIDAAHSEAADPAQVTLNLPELKPGAYRVTWDALSTDDLHITSGSIVFGVQTAAGSAVVQIESAPSAADVIVRWIDFVALTTLIGSVVTALVARSLSEANADLIAAVTRRLLSLALWATVAALFTGSGGLVSQAVTLRSGNTSVLEALGQLLTQTSYGSRWLMREGWSIVLLGIIIWQRRQINVNRLVLGATLPLLIALLVLQAMNGHATAFNDSALVRVVADAVHLLAAGLWVGGLIAVAVAVVPLLRRGPEEAALARLILKRFGVLAASSLGMLLVTGLYNSGQQVASLDALLFTLYGQALMLKIGLIVIVGLIGLINSALLHPRVADVIRRVLRRPIGWRPISPRLLRRTVLIEAIGASSILLLAAVLGSSQPARGPQFDPPREDATAQTATTNVDGLFVTFSIKPNRPGQNFMSIGAFNTRRPAPAPIEQLKVRLVSPNDEPIDSVAKLTAKDKYQITGEQIGQPGEWQISIEAQRPGMPVARWAFPWTVLPASTLSARPVRVSNQPLAPWLELAALISAGLMASATALVWWRQHRPRPVASARREIEHDIHSMPAG